MWIETDDSEVINLGNFDRLYIRSKYSSETVSALIAWKATDSEYDGYEAVLCVGLEAHCQDELARIADGLRTNANVVTVRSMLPEPKPRKPWSKYRPPSKPLIDLDEIPF